MVKHGKQVFDDEAAVPRRREANQRLSGVDNMNFPHFYEKLSLSVIETCTSTDTLKGRLRRSLKNSFTPFSAETPPEDLRGQFTHIKTALTGARVGGNFKNYPDAIDRMKSAEVRRMLNEIFHLYQISTTEYYRRWSCSSPPCQHP
jgi:hypothetical protein